MTSLQDPTLDMGPLEESNISNGVSLDESYIIGDELGSFGVDMESRNSEQNQFKNKYDMFSQYLNQGDNFNDQDEDNLQSESEDNLSDKDDSEDSSTLISS